MSSSPDRPPKGLTHNPFAKLRPDGLPAEARPQTRKDDDPTQRPASGRGSGRVIVRRQSKGQGGKTVTIAEGPGLDGVEVALLAREAAKALGSGARAVDGTLVVQGDLALRLVAWLTQRGFGPVTRGN